MALLHRLDELASAPPSATVHLAEGLKDADALLVLDLVASSAPCGTLRGRHAHYNCGVTSRAVSRPVRVYRASPAGVHRLLPPKPRHLTRPPAPPTSEASTTLSMTVGPGWWRGQIRSSAHPPLSVLGATVIPGPGHRRAQEQDASCFTVASWRQALRPFFEATTRLSTIRG